MGKGPHPQLPEQQMEIQLRQRRRLLKLLLSLVRVEGRNPVLEKYTPIQI
jgi:hypothetical protein